MNNNITLNLSGHLLMMDWDNKEQLINLKDLVDKFKLDMQKLIKRDDTSTDLILYMDKEFSKGLKELAEYSENYSITINDLIN
jgi:hypothetical protein